MPPSGAETWGAAEAGESWVNRFVSSVCGAAALGAIAAFGTGAAQGADFPRYPSPPPYAANFGVYNWSGAYLGLNLGYQWSNATNLGANPSGFMGGVQGGYNWQNGQFVFGLEADLQGSTADDTFAPYKFSNPWFGTVRGRGGVAINNVLLYLTAGVAYGGTKLTFGPFDESHVHLGWTAGAGIEVGLTPNWSAKAEALYVDLSGQNYGLTGFSHGLESGVVRLGVNYRF